MKTGIITFQDAQNFGAALQCYALKNICNNYCKTEVINYYNHKFHKKGKLSIKSVILYCLNFNWKLIRNYKFKKFQCTELVNSNKYLHDKELVDLNNVYDKFITGSDQVWNLDCSGNNYTYFLDFVNDNKKKYSYAASFGTSDIKYDDFMISSLKSFNKISVREESARISIKNNLNLDTIQVLDPTLLLSKKEWKEKFNLNFEEKYILIYEVLNSTHLLDEAIKLSKKTNLKIVCISNSNRRRKGVINKKGIGPKEWLDLFSKASFVLTNSFHGLVFSLNFQKQFWVELLDKTKHNTNARMMEILSMVNLNQRILNVNLDHQFDNVIDYTKVSLLLNKYIEKSKKYIIDILSEDN